MRPFLLACSLLLALPLCACGGAQTQATASAAVAPARPAQATCPVMGKTFTPDDHSEYAEYKGTTYWFCCPGCREKFLASPEKYVAGGPAAATTPAGPAQAVCPVSGEKFTPGPNTPTAEYKGQTYRFCCPGCVGRFKADPEKYLNKAPGAEAGGCMDEGGK